MCGISCLRSQFMGPERITHVYGVVVPRLESTVSSLLFLAARSKGHRTVISLLQLIAPTRFWVPAVTWSNYGKEGWKTKTKCAWVRYIKSFIRLTRYVAVHCWLSTNVLQRLIFIPSVFTDSFSSLFFVACFRPF